MQFCFLASSVDATGMRRLETSDRAAVHWALQSSVSAIAVCSADDMLAKEFAIASGIRKILIAEATPAQTFDLAWAGGGFAERFGEAYLARWAEHVSATLLFEVLQCHTAPDGTRTIHCDAGRGARDELHVRGPCVLALSSSVPRTPYISRHRRQTAHQDQKAISPDVSASAVPANSLPEWVPARPRVRKSDAQVTRGADDRMDSAFSMAAGSSSHAQHLIVADADTCAQHLLRYLAHHGFLHGIKDAWPLAGSTTAPTVFTTNKPRAASRTLSPALQRRPRWQDAPANPSRGPFWCELSSSPD